MTKRRAMAAMVASALVVLSVSTLASAGAVRGEATAVARVSNAAGERLGIVRFVSKDGKVRVNSRFAHLAPGFHGFHVHAVGSCEPPFTSAGGHLNPTGASHGAHAGDMPPLLVTSDGTASLRFTTDRFTLQQLFDGDGSSVIVYADPDNLAHIPARYHSHTENMEGPDSVTKATGDAGSRTGCGVIQQVNRRRAALQLPLGN